MVQFIPSLLILKRVVFVIATVYSLYSFSDSKLGQDVEITSQKLSLNYGQNIAEYYGNVQVKYNGAIITCDRAEILFAPKTKSQGLDKNKSALVDIIKFYGNVVISSKDNQAYSDYGVFTKNNNLVVLEQNVRLKEKSGYIKGSKLVYDAKKQKMKMVNEHGNKRVTVVINN